MNEPVHLPQSPEPIAADDLAAPPVHSGQRTFAWWLKRFLACNPFYLVSAALLLYGVYRVSTDPSFLQSEPAQLTFNFTSLQLYEVLLVATAIFLARRRIWYDSTLLVGVENGLLLVPFILISAASLIDTRLVWLMCLTGGAIASARFGSLKRFIGELNFPKRLTVVGLVVLTVNLALPILYRVLHEHKFGTKPDFGAAYHTNRCVWLLLLPVLCAAANLLPRFQRTGKLLPQRGWLPPGLFSLWLVATGVHLYSLGYVYDFDLRPEFLAPAIWVVLWTARNRPRPLGLSPQWERALLVPPLLATLLAATSTGGKVFLALSLVNAVIYARLFFKDREQRLALQLALISVAALVAGLPEEWGRHLVANFSREHGIGAALLGYLLLWVWLARTPKHAIFGALVAAVAVIAACSREPEAGHWAIQVALAFLLAHSIRWQDTKEAGAKVLQILTAVLWVGHACVWMHQGGTTLEACNVAVPVLLVFLAGRLLNGKWGSLSVPGAALLVMLSGPGEFTVGRVPNAPAGLLAILGSFALFGVGTLVAITRHRWHGQQPEHTGEK